MQPTYSNYKNLPTHITKLVVSLNNIEEPRLKLWASFELTEMLLRWIFAVTIAEVYAKNDEIPEKIIKQLRDKIGQPTMGNWRHYCEVSCNAVLKQKLPITSEIATIFNQHDKENSWGKIIKLRNDFVHGGAVTAARAQDILSQFVNHLCSAVDQLDEAHQDRSVWARFGKLLFLLKGEEEQTSTKNEGLPKGDGTWFGNREVGFVSIKPLLVYEPIYESWEQGDFTSVVQADRKLVSQSYFKFDDKRLYYTPIGVDDFISVNPDLDVFKKMFPIDIKQEFDQILDAQIAAYRRRQRLAFMGRTEEIKIIKLWYSNNDYKVGLVVGHAGFGKSALIGHLSNEFYSEQLRTAPNLRKTCFIYHAFNAEDPFNDTRQFLENVYEQTTLFLNKQLGKDKKYRSYSVDRLKDEIVTNFEKIASAGSDRSVLMMVDGLDEILLLNPKFGILIGDDLCMPGVRTVATTRPTKEADLIDAATTIERIHFKDEDTLPGMTGKDIRSMLIDGLDKHGKEILNLDVEDSNGMVANAYVEKVVKHADGAPIYVDLLIFDIEAGNSKIDPDVTLPSRLEDFYFKILGREGISDTKVHQAVLICLLALVNEPASENLLVEIFASMPGEIDRQEANLKWVKTAISEASVFISSVETSDGDQGYYLYHQEFKEFISSSKESDSARPLEWALGFAKWLLVQASLNIGISADEATSKHFLRHGDEYILSWRKKVLENAADLKSSFELVSDHISDMDYLAQTYSAWRSNGQEFLEWFVRNYNLLSIDQSPERSDNLIKQLSEYIVSRYGGHDIDSRITQASISYRKDAKQIYSRILEFVVGGHLDHAFENEARKSDKVDWLSDAGSIGRREGNPASARDSFVKAQQLLKALADTEGMNILKSRSLLHYEIGYLDYSLGDIPKASLEMEASRDYAVQGSNYTGVVIADCLLGMFDLRQKRAKGEGLTNEAISFERLLKNHKQDLFDISHDMNKSRGVRLTAERWIMNCRAHSFDAAYFRGDATAATEYIEEFLEDPWVVKQEATTKGVFAFKEFRRAQYFQLLGRNSEAIDIYKLLCPVLSKGEAEPEWKEAVAMNYLDYGHVLVVEGEQAKARLIWESGIQTNDNYANSIWKDALKNQLATLSP